MSELKLKPLGKNANLLKSYFEKSPVSFCDISVGVKYMWRDDFLINYAEIEDTLIMQESCADYENAFYFPIGEKVDTALDLIEKHAIKKGEPLLFCCIDNHYATVLAERYPFCKVYNDRDWSDYIYDAEKFKTYSGKKLSGQRNHVNKFKRLYPDYTFKVMEESDFGEIAEFLKAYELGNDFSAWSAKEEQKKVADYVKNFKTLDQVGGLIKVNGKVVAISVGEIIGNTLIVHVEKGLKDYEGVYPTIASEFAKAFAVGNVKFINREEDCGDMGLRVSKLQYKPVDIKEKNLVKVYTLFDKLSPPILIKTERLEITDIFEQDKENYFKLYTDDKLNEFYGYDYREDFKDGIPTPDYFFEFMQGLKDKREEYSLGVKLDNRLIGEIVLYNFEYRGGAEIGFRFFPEYQGKGYALESVTAVIEYIKSLGCKTVYCRAFKENKKSLNLIEKLGLIKITETEKQLFFKKEL